MSVDFLDFFIEKTTFEESANKFVKNKKFNIMMKKIVYPNIDLLTNFYVPKHLNSLYCRIFDTFLCRF